ncbi:MAG: quinone-dependent dihydroorotate dehydrogenase [Sphingomonadaceae bacterium]|nr:quinone-dependent dihydroorotate dehydrogenase [Sphingomonadaceae bacterium]
MFGRHFVRILHAMDAEFAHKRTIDALSLLPLAAPPRTDPALAMSVAGLDFAHPVCLAAGFDKDARALHAMARFGFAGAEAGTLTPLPQLGNPRPRLFRLTEDLAVINRMGFNNGGHAAAAPRIAAHFARQRRIPFGINIGANKDATDRIADYVTGVARFAMLADWLTINISSPNTPGLRALQDGAALDDLLGAVAAARTQSGAQVPIFLKVAPDLDGAQIGGVVAAAITHQLDAIIIGNTTVSRPQLSAAHGGETGGLSGAPLEGLAFARLLDFVAASQGQIALIAAGGISSAEHVWRRIAAGASLTQLYSAMVYEGPWLAAKIIADLTLMLRASEIGTLMALKGSKIAPPPPSALARRG